MKTIPCPDCGPAPVSHPREYYSALIDWLLSPVTNVLDMLWRAVAPLCFALHLEHIALPLMRLAAALGIGRIETQPRASDTGRTRVLWDAAKVRGIDLREFWLFGRRIDVFVARYKGTTRVFNGLPRPRGLAAQSLDWMDDKGIMKQKFTAAGIPVARGGTATTEAGALKLFRSTDHPVIAKPNLGSRSRHTVTDIADETELIRAFHVAQELSPWVVIEEQLTGSVFRGTIVGARVVGVLRRDAPQVTGDGAHTVRELVAEENKNPKRHGPIFHEIALDADADAELARQGLTWESVPARGRVVRLNQKVGRGQGATNTDVTDLTHPENIKLLEKVGAVLKDPLVGIDFILSDITLPWTEQQHCGVIECNSLPFLDLHHYPFSGEPRDAAGALWALIFPSP